MKVKTLQPHVYEGTLRNVGAEYEMEDRFYPAMSAMGHVLRSDQPAVMHTRDLESQPPKQYRRRDLSAK